jgi:hypothetical protein
MLPAHTVRRLQRGDRPVLELSNCHAKGAGPRTGAYSIVCHHSVINMNQLTGDSEPNRAKPASREKGEAAGFQFT